jgi:hypothetical protein
VPEPVSKAAYAARAGVSPSAVSRWISRGNLTPPALREDGTINPELADAQLAQTVAPRSRDRADRVSATTPELARAAMLSMVFGSFEAEFFPAAVQTLALSETQRGQLARCWFDFRAKASRG